MSSTISNEIFIFMMEALSDKLNVGYTLGVQILIFTSTLVYNQFIYTYLGADKLCYAISAFRFAYN